MRVFNIWYAPSSQSPKGLFFGTVVSFHIHIWIIFKIHKFSIHITGVSQIFEVAFPY